MAGPVAIIGVFDGVHHGHRALVSSARIEADRRGVPLVAITFDPHPLSVVRPGSEPPLLATVAHRRSLLREAGVDDVVVLAFDDEFSQLSPEQFVESVLVDRVRASAVLVGRNFTFGHRAVGTVATLTEIGARQGFDVVGVDLDSDSDGTVSSTRVRALVSEGDVASARALLGRPHRVQGPVIHGDHRGREIGYPTANLRAVGGVAIPADGVYAGILIVDPDGAAQPSWCAAISVGTNPTFGDNYRRVEAFAIDADPNLDLYGLDVAVDFLEFLRPMVAFEGLDPLLEQMARDVESSREICRRDR